MKFKVGEQFIVRQLPKSRQIISHDIVTPLDVGQSCKTAVEPLVSCLQAKEAGRNAGSSRPFALPSESRGVVSERVDSGFTAVDVVHEHVVLRRPNSAG